MPNEINYHLMQVGILKYVKYYDVIIIIMFLRIILVITNNVI